MLFISNHFNVLNLRIFFKILNDKLIGQIVGLIVNDDDFVVRVVEVEYALDVVEISVVFGVIVGRDDNAKRQFFWIFIKLILL